MTTIRRHAPAVLVSLIAVIILTWPLAPRFNQVLPGAAIDGQENAWDVWWAREALLVRRSNPFWATTLYYPDGTSLYFHPLTLAAAPLAVPLQSVVDAPATVALTLLALLWLTALTTYALVWDIVRHRAAALVAGVFVALAPAHLYHLLLGQLNLAAFFAVPLILLAQRRSLRRERRWVALGAVSVVACALADWQYVVLAAIMAGVLLAADLWRARRRPARAMRVLAWGSAPLVAGCILLLPLALVMIGDLEATRSSAGVAYAERPLSQAVLRSTDLLALVAPNPYHPLWGAAGQALYAHLYPQIPFAGGVASFGLAALAVALAVARRWRATARIWLAMLAVGLALALGPSLHVGGYALDVPLPYRLLRLVPYMDVSRVPAVFLKAALLALAILLALGLRGLAAWAGRGWRGVAGTVALAAFVVFEGLAAPLPLPPRPPISSCYRLLANDPRPGAVLDLPAIDADEPMYYQTIHGRPVAGGDLSRDNPYPFLSSTPIVSALVRGQRAWPPDILSLDDGPAARSALAGWGLRWVVLRPADAGPARPRFEAALTRVFGETPPVCADEEARLWRVDDEPGPMVLRLGAGWHAPEQMGDAAPYRWLSQEGMITVYMPAAGQAELTMAARAHGRQRTLELWLGHERLGQAGVPAGQEQPLIFSMRLPSGRSMLRLSAIEPAEPGGGADTRPLTIAVASLDLRQGERS